MNSLKDELRRWSVSLWVWPKPNQKTSPVENVVSVYPSQKAKNLRCVPFQPPYRISNLNTQTYRKLISGVKNNIYKAVWDILWVDQMSSPTFLSVYILQSSMYMFVESVALILQNITIQGLFGRDFESYFYTFCSSNLLSNIVFNKF